MKRIDFISFEEFQQLYKAEENKKIKLFMSLAFGSGLRISEILGSYKDISACCKEEVIKKKVKEVGRTKTHYLCSKCNKDLNLSKEVKRNFKEFNIPPLTKDMINLKEHKINLALAKGNKWRTTVTPPNLREKDLDLLPLKLRRRMVEYHIEHLSVKVLGKKISPHIFRHGFGNYQANVLRVPLPIVQQLMGHSRLDTTGIYTKANPDFAIQQVWKAMTGES
jgi:integrase